MLRYQDTFVFIILMLLGFWEKAPSHTYQPFNILLCIYAIFLAVSIRKPAWYYIAMYNQVAGNVSLVWEMYVFNQPILLFSKIQSLDTLCVCDIGKPFTEDILL